MIIDTERKCLVHHLIEKVNSVLNLFSFQHPEWGVREAAEALNLPKSTMGDILLSLAEQRLLRRTSSGRYQLGWHLFELSQVLLEQTAFCIQARHIMHELVERWGETTHLAVLDGMQLLFVEKLQGTPAVQILLSRVGGRIPAHAGSMGKVLLATQVPSYTLAHLLAEQELAAYTPNTITDRKKLEQELEQVRTLGYAHDREEVVQGLCCVAAPICDQNGNVLAAMSLSIPAYRFFAQEDHYTDVIVQAALRVSEQLGYQVDRKK
jgi:IclR family KDG regulon transcriptional repressor